MSLRRLTPRERIAAIADAGSVESAGARFEATRPSAHLARWGIAAQDDDGIVVARATVHGLTVLFAAQDERFLSGSAGANHGDTLCALFGCARAERPAAVVLLAASGGVRLHEANPAELSLARALTAMLDARAAGIPVFAIGVGDVFGGSSVVVCAAERVAMLPGTRVGLSGPRVLELARGTHEFDAADANDVAAVYGAEARTREGQIELLADDADAIRSWIEVCTRGTEPFAAHVEAMHGRLAECLPDRPLAPPSFAPPVAGAQRVDDDGWLWRLRERRAWITRAPGNASFGPEEARALDSALLRTFVSRDDCAGTTLVVIEDSAGHSVTRAAELMFVSRFLGQHAAALSLLRARGVRLVGLLTGTGHSAAFFANALQAPLVVALAGAQVVAMEPAAIARVTRLPADRIAALVEGNPLIGHPVRHFADWGGIDEVRAGAVGDAVDAIVGRDRSGAR